MVAVAFHLTVAKGNTINADQFNNLGMMLEETADENVAAMNEANPDWSRAQLGWEIFTMYKLAAQSYDNAANCGGVEARHFQANRTECERKANEITKAIAAEEGRAL